ncbi:VWA domain-containing protein [Chloroflexota bacterium]
MDEEELNKKLENIDLPEIELPDYIGNLRMALLESEYANNKRDASIFTKVPNWIKRYVYIAADSLTPKRLNWKLALVSTLAIALVISMSVFIPPLVNQTPGNESLVKVDDWRLGNKTLSSNGTTITGGGSTVTSGGTAVTSTVGSQPPPTVKLPQPTVVVPGISPDPIGLSVGGANDINNFRENIANDYLPLPTDMTYEGLFYDYYFDTGQTEECDELFCPSYSYAVTNDPFSGETEYYLSVGLNSGIKESEFQRKKLNLVIVLDVSSSMSGSFGEYYYDQFGEKVELSEEDQGMAKIEVAKQSIVAMLDHLDDEDRLGIVLFNRDAYLAKPINLVGETDMEAIGEHILDIEVKGNTNLYSGMVMATDLFEDLRDVDQSEYENRIIFITDAMPNTGETEQGSFLSKLEQSAENHLYSTFIGIGVDFNSELIEHITKTRGANYYSVHAPAQFKERMDDEFEYMVTPLVFDLQLTLEAEGWEIEKVYGSPEANEATGELMKVNTLFPSKMEGGETKGGLILLKLKKITEDSNLKLKASYEDRNGNQKSIESTVVFNNEEPEFFANSGIRKGVLLARYADLIKNWLIDEYEHAHFSYPWEPRVNNEDGIIVPSAMLGEWERQSLPLYVSPPYKELFRQFSEYFQNEVEAIGDETLTQGLEILEILLTTNNQD